MASTNQTEPDGNLNNSTKKNINFNVYTNTPTTPQQLLNTLKTQPQNPTSNKKHDITEIAF